MISSLAAFHFMRPGFLLLLPAWVLLWWFWRRGKDPLQGWRTVMQPELLRALTTGGRQQRDWSGLLLLGAWLLMSLGLAGPTWKPEPSPFADDPIPVMILLSADGTMALDDLAPSRMERARLKVIDFAEARKGRPLGLIAYAGSAHLVLPPTRDGAIVGTMAANVSPEIMPVPGSDLPAALARAAETLQESGGSILLVTDAVSGGLGPELEAFRQQYPLPVTIHAIAVEGSAERNAIDAAARALKADVVGITVDGSDTAALLRQVERTPVGVGGDQDGTRWAEAGYWLLPVIAIFVLLQFRRETSEESGA